MEPSKPEGVSRHSSILKLPKQRQPLQCVIANPSSSESSPTVKIKRRVSFAKNRRIREFCNEDESETVWHNTYEEEHDLSSTKNSNNSTEQALIISVPCDDKENFPVQLFMKNSELECREVSTNILSEEGNNLEQYEMEMDASINASEPIVQMQNQGAEIPNTTIYCDDGMDITLNIPTNIIPCYNQNETLEDTVLVSRNNTQDATNITENMSLNLLNKLKQYKNLDTKSACNSTDLTQAISLLLKPGTNETLSGIDAVSASHFKESCDLGKTMEFTSILPSSTWIKPDSKCQNVEKIENFTTRTMEFTLAVPNSNILRNKIQSETSCLSEKTNIFSAKSMEMTEAISTKPVIKTVTDAKKLIEDKSKVFPNTFMKMTEVIPTNKMHQTSINVNNVVLNTMQEKTNIFMNKSMEITESVPLHDFATSTQKISPQEMQNKTNIFADVPIEMTEILPIINKLPQFDTKRASPNLSHEQTKVFTNKYMEITGVVPINSHQNETKLLSNASIKVPETTPFYHNTNNGSRKTLEDNPEKIGVPCNQSSEMTEVTGTYKKAAHPLSDNTNFVDKTMEFTEAVPVYRTVQQSKVNTEFLGEKTNIFVDKSMEMTEGVPLHTKIQQPNALSKTIEEKTNVFANQSMEMTEAVPWHMKIQQQNTLSKTIGEKTNIFANQSMEMTEAVPLYMKIQQPTVLSKTTGEKTNIFANQSMEMTEAVPLHMKIQQPTVLSKTIGEKTNIFGNQSMEMTEAVPLHMKIQQPTLLSKTIGEKTNIFANQSMEMTEAVPMHMKILEPNTLSKTIEEKTNVFVNESMEMTEAVPLHMKIQQPTVLSKTIGEKTNIFANQSMEMTEAIPLHLKIQQPTVLSKTIGEKTNIFANQSMEMTEAVPLHMKIQQPTVLSKTVGEKTYIFANQSMEMTEAVPLHMKIQQPTVLSKTIDEKTNIFANQSMEMTEAVPLHMKIQQPTVLSKTVGEKTNIFANQSMEMTEAVPLHMKIQQPTVLSKTIGEKQNIFANQSMEMTEAIPLHLKIQQPTVLSKTIGEKTNIFANQSMEMTEAVPLHMKIQQPTVLSKTVGEKTNIFANQSMEMTEAVPLYMKIQQPNALSKTIGEKTNIFANQSMEMTEAVPRHMKIQEQNALSKTVGEKTNIFANQSMEMTEAVPLHMKIQQPTVLSKTIDEKTNIFANQSMEMTEAVPLHMRIQQPTVLSKTVGEKTNIFANQSMEMTEAVPRHMKIQQQNALSKTIGEKTNSFANQSMEMTEAVPLYMKIQQPNALSITKDEKTNIFANQSMEMTEAGNQYKQNNIQEKTKVFIDKSMDMTEMIATYKNYRSPNMQLEKASENKATEMFPNSSKELTINMSNMLPARNSNSNSLNKNVDNRQSKNNNDFMEMTTELPISKTTVRDLTTQHKNDNDLQKTEISRKRPRDFDSYYEPKRNLQDVELSRMLPISMNSKHDLNKLNHYNNQNISSKKIDDIQRTGHVSNYDRGNDDNSERISFREETIHRLTSDELNTLCASVNLPSQKYSKNESMHTPNNFNSSCNDINVLRASLEKNNLFQQSDSTHKNNRMSEKEIGKDSKNSDENIKKRNIFGAIPSMNTQENLNQPQEKEDRIPVPMEVSEIHKHSTNKFSVFEVNNDLSLQTDVLCKSNATPLTAMETEKTAEFNLKQPENQHSYYNPSKSLHSNLLSNTGNLQNLSQSRDKINNLHVSVNVSTVQGYTVNESITVHQSFGHSNHKVSNSCTTTRMSIDIEKDAAAQTDLDHSKWPSSKIQIYHDSMEVAPVSSKLPIPKKKFDFRETEEFINRNNNTASNTVGSAHTLVKLCNKENNENRLIKLPSDNTDILLATSGCKTETQCPAVINEENVIKISNRSLINKTYVLNADSKIGQVEKNKTFVVTTDSKIECQPESNKTFVLNTNSKLESQINPYKTFVVTANSNIENQVETNKTYVVSRSTDKITLVESKLTSNQEQNAMRSDTELREHAINISSVESKESSLISNLLQEKFPNELDEIEPPSFLYSNSMHENTNESVLKSNDLNSSNNLSKHDPIILSPEKKENVNVNRSPDCKQISRKTEKYEKDNTLSEIKNNAKCKEATKKTKMKKIAKPEREVEVIIKKPIEEPVEEPLTPFESLTEDLRKHEKSDECIWQIRTITPKTVAIDFITKSFVVIIRLNEFEKACIKDIENIEIKSLLRSDSKNTLLKIVHNLLLEKIKPSELLEKYKMYEDILPLLDYISSEVLFAMKFKFDLERLSALNLMNVDHERISFMVASRKTNIILKVSLVLKVFNNIGPDDIDVICVLGDIRKNDIKQLIVNIKRDYKFLSRYIKDVKDYITLMEDSTYRFKGHI